jgi:hypothetical protein
VASQEGLSSTKLVLINTNFLLLSLKTYKALKDTGGVNGPIESGGITGN